MSPVVVRTAADTLSAFQRFLEEGEQAFPMPLRASLVVDGMVGNAPAVPATRIVFHRVVDACLAEDLREARRLLRRETAVIARDAHMNPPPDAAGMKMGTVGNVTGKIATMPACRCRDAIRMAS